MRITIPARPVIALALVGAAAHFAAPTVADLRTDVRAKQDRAGSALTCNVAAMEALTTENEAALDRAEKLCGPVR